MQAPRILSQEQRHALESTYTFLKGATVYLEAVQPCVLPEDRVHLDNLVNFGVLCISLLAENFSEVASWERTSGAS